MTNMQREEDKQGKALSADEDLQRHAAEFLGDLERIEKKCAHSTFDESTLTDLSASIQRMSRHCKAYEEAVSFDIERIRAAQADFRKRTDHHFLKSYFMLRSRTWPMGYPGDYETLEGIYRNGPMSTGIGYYLDLHFLKTTLATAVRERKDLMREILKEEIQLRKAPAILNLACGSCREIVEIASLIQHADATLMCVDIDPNALDFAANRFAHAKLPSSMVQFRKYNAIKMINAERNQKEFGLQDIIYSIGLFDYLDDNVLIRLLGALYESLRPGGVLITSFKDRTRYETYEYHWFVDWSSFLQRTEADVRALFDAARIPSSPLSMSRIPNGAVYFLRATK